MDVDDPGKLRPALVSVRKFSLEDRETMDAGVDLRLGQESCDRVQDIDIALLGIVKSRGIDEGNRYPIQSKARGLDVDCARLQVVPDM